MKEKCWICGNVIDPTVKEDDKWPYHVVFQVVQVNYPFSYNVASGSGFICQKCSKEHIGIDRWGRRVKVSIGVSSPLEEKTMTKNLKLVSKLTETIEALKKQKAECDRRAQEVERYIKKCTEAKRMLGTKAKRDLETILAQ